MRRILLISVILVFGLSQSSCGNSTDINPIELKMGNASLYQDPSNRSHTLLEVPIILRNKGTEAVGVDGKFYFTAIKKSIQLKSKKMSNTSDRDSFFSKIPVSEMSVLSLNSWSSVSEVFDLLKPYQEKQYLVAISVPTGTYIENIFLENQGTNPKTKYGWVSLWVCPHNNDSLVGEFWQPGMTCENGKLVATH